MALCIMMFFGTIPVVCNLVTAEGLSAAEQSRAKTTATRGSRMTNQVQRLRRPGQATDAAVDLEP